MKWGEGERGKGQKKKKKTTTTKNEQYRMNTEKEDRKRTRREKSPVGCLTSQQHASVSQGQICEDNFTCCHTEIQAADPTFHLTQSQYTDTVPTGPSTDSITPGAWQGSHWTANF